MKKLYISPRCQTTVMAPGQPLNAGSESFNGSTMNTKEVRSNGNAGSMAASRGAHSWSDEE